MAFYPYQHNLGDVPVMHLPIGNIAVKPGDALVLVGGKLAIAKDAVMPEYISLYDSDGVKAADGKMIPVEPVLPSTIYETELTGSLSTVALGTTHLISYNGASITTASEQGPCKVVGCDGTAKGSRVRLIFVDPKAATAAANA